MPQKCQEKHLAVDGSVIVFVAIAALIAIAIAITTTITVICTDCKSKISHVLDKIIARKGSLCKCYTNIKHCTSFTSDKMTMFVISVFVQTDY